jgi:hypothetical protein
LLLIKCHVPAISDIKPAAVTKTIYQYGTSIMRGQCKKWEVILRVIPIKMGGSNPNTMELTELDNRADNSQQQPKKQKPVVTMQV